MTSDHARYGDWDAAYVLGALSPAERREFELHLETCPRCTSSVAELAAMPGLLGRLGTEQGLALLDEPAFDQRREQAGEPGVTAPLPGLVDRIAARDRARRTRRIRWIGALAAAALAVAAAITVPIVVNAQPPHPTAVIALHTTSANPLSADVSLTSVKWGTKIDMSCSYAAGDGVSYAGPWSYSLWVIGRDGSRSEVSSWNAYSGTTARVQSGTALAVADIATLEVHSVKDDSVLLSGSVSN